MDRRKLLVSALGIFPLTAVCLFAKKHDDSKGKGKGKGHQHDHDDEDNDWNRGRSGRYFRQQDYAVVQRYYDGPRDLPPGLRKKYYRTGTLPPGWQKKLRPFPPALIQVLPPPPPNCEFGYMDGVAVVYDRKTRIILDTIDLIGAISGR
jgi:hypothetical protein